MKKPLIILCATLAPLLSYAQVDCSSPKYAANPSLKRACVSLQQSAATALQSNTERFDKDYTQNQLALEAQIKEKSSSNHAPPSDESVHAPSTAPNAAAPTTPQPNTTTPPPSVTPTPEPANAEPESPTQPAPTPSGKPRRYY